MVHHARTQLAQADKDSITNKYKTDEARFKQWLIDTVQKWSLEGVVQLGLKVTDYGLEIEKENLIPCVALAMYHGEVSQERFADLEAAIEGRKLCSQKYYTRVSPGWKSHQEYEELLTELAKWLRPIVERQKPTLSVRGQSPRCACQQKQPPSSSDDEAIQDVEIFTGQKFDPAKTNGYRLDDEDNFYAWMFTNIQKLPLTRAIKLQEDGSRARVAIPDVMELVPFALLIGLYPLLINEEVIRGLHRAISRRREVAKHYNPGSDFRKQYTLRTRELALTHNVFVVVDDVRTRHLHEHQSFQELQQSHEASINNLMQAGHELWKERNSLSEEIQTLKHERHPKRLIASLVHTIREELDIDMDL